MEMLEKSLTQIESKVKMMIETSLKSGDNDKVVGCARYLERMNVIRREYDVLSAKLESLQVELANGTDSTSNHRSIKPQDSEQKATSRTEARQFGKSARVQLLNTLSSRGVELTRITDRVYSDSHDRRIGVSYSKFHSYPKQWWLGLPDEDYHVVILICRTKDGRFLNVCFNRAFCMKYLKHMSRDERGELKFSIKLESSGMVIKIPGYPDVSVEEYIDNLNVFFDTA